MIKRIVNKNRETVGLVKVIEYKDRQIVRGYEGYHVLSREEKAELIRKINKAVEEAKAEIEAEEKKQRHKESLKKFLNRMSREEYLNFEQMKKAIALNPNLIYMYDLISGLDEFKATKRGIRGTDATGKTVYLYPKDNYKFYKSAFLGVY